MGPVGLLEREGELATTGDAIDGCVGGADRLVALEGPAGIGKTRLPTAARERASEADMRVLSARGGTLEPSFGYGVVRQLFEPALARSTVEEKDEAFAGAAALAPPPFEALSSGGDEGLGPGRGGDSYVTHTGAIGQGERHGGRCGVGGTTRSTRWVWSGSCRW